MIRKVFAQPRSRRKHSDPKHDYIAPLSASW